MKFNRYMIAAFSLLMLGSLQAQNKNSSPIKESYLAVVAIGAKPSPRNYIPGQSKHLPKKVLKELKEELEQMKVDQGLTDAEYRQLLRTPMVLPPHKDQVPPNTLVAQGVDGEPFRISVGFNSNPTFVKVPAAKSLTMKRYRRPGKLDEAPYLTTKKLTPGSRTLMIVLPPYKPPLMWKVTPKSFHYLNLDSANNVGKTVQVINLSKSDVAFKMGGKSWNIKPSTRVGEKPSSFKGQYQNYEAMVASSDYRISKGSAKLSSTSLNLFVFYDANPKSNGGKRIALFKTRVTLPKKLVAQ